MFLVWQIGSLQRYPGITRNQNDILFRETVDNSINNFAEVTRGHRTEMNDPVSTSASASCSSTDPKEHILRVNVKYRNVSSTIDISNDSSVDDLKSTILKRFELPSDSEESTKLYHLIYCGSALNEKLPLMDLDLTNGSNLHVIKIDPKDKLLSSFTGAPKLMPSDYYSYCPVCKDIQASKLRIKCLECSSLSSFLINPNNQIRCREDAFTCTTVNGSCSHIGCKGTRARLMFQCRQNHQITNTVSLKHIRNNSRHIICITCEEDLSPVIVFPCESQHTMCLNCFKIYSIICLNERRFQQTNEYGYTLSCPAGCLNSHIQENHHFRVLGPEEYERYKTFAAEEFLLKEGGTCCPNPECGEGLIPDSNSNTICCCNCQRNFCRLCSCDSQFCRCGHQPVESSDLSMLPSTEVLKKCQWEKESMSLIDQISKSCPKCKVKTEKNGGCNHMYCSRCEGEWCWICVKPWTNACMEDHWLD